MNKKRKQSGFVLLYVILLLPLFSMGVWLLMQDSLLLIRETKMQGLRTDVRNLLCSGRAWAGLHRQELLAAEPGTVFRPEIAELEILHGTCQLQVVSQTDSACTIQIQASSAVGRVSYETDQTLTLSKQLQQDGYHAHVANLLD